MFDKVEAIDQGTLHTMKLLQWDWLQPIMAGLTHLGDSKVLLGVVLVAALFLALRRHWRTALVVVAVPVAAHYLCEALKGLVNRRRPDEVWMKVPVPQSSSFPSGHAFTSMAAYLIIALALVQAFRLRRGPSVVLVGIALLLAMVIGFTRMFLGLHYLSDVVAGWVGGLACALLGQWVIDRWERHPEQAARR
jgi:undecaprenyl-diphosphatase